MISYRTFALAVVAILTPHSATRVQAQSETFTFGENPGTVTCSGDATCTLGENFNAAQISPSKGCASSITTFECVSGGTFLIACAAGATCQATCDSDVCSCEGCSGGTDPTDAPADPTDSPVDPTDAPAVDPTEAPVNPTDTPVDPPTDAPADPTDSPIDPTDAPTVDPTEAPVNPTDIPVDPPTAAPSAAMTQFMYLVGSTMAIGMGSILMIF